MTTTFGRIYPITLTYCGCCTYHSVSLAASAVVPNLSVPFLFESNVTSSDVSYGRCESILSWTREALT